MHIAARVLGHHSLNTTQADLAVFQDDLIRAYRGFLDTRRATRPQDDYREPTDAEWLEFQQHFELRKVELGSCDRPYATPCAHEHACIRCPMLRIDPAQRTRLVEIIANLGARITEARTNGWLGEVQGLRTSLDAATKKLASLDRTAACGLPGPTTWLNLVEIFFGILTRQAIRRGTFTSVADLEAAIGVYIDARNDRCQPFTWTKEADTILARATPPKNRNTNITSETRH